MISTVAKRLHYIPSSSTPGKAPLRIPVSTDCHGGAPTFTTSKVRVLSILPMVRARASQCAFRMLLLYFPWVPAVQCHRKSHSRTKRIKKVVHVLKQYSKPRSSNLTSRYNKNTRPPTAVFWLLFRPEEEKVFLYYPYSERTQLKPQPKNADVHQRCAEPATCGNSTSHPTKRKEPSTSYTSLPAVENYICFKKNKQKIRQSSHVLQALPIAYEALQNTPRFSTAHPTYSLKILARHSCRAH